MILFLQAFVLFASVVLYFLILYSPSFDAFGLRLLFDVFISSGIPFFLSGSYMSHFYYHISIITRNSFERICRGCFLSPETGRGMTLSQGRGEFPHKMVTGGGSRLNADDKQYSNCYAIHITHIIK